MTGCESDEIAQAIHPLRYLRISVSRYCMPPRELAWGELTSVCGGFGTRVEVSPRRSLWVVPERDQNLRFHAPLLGGLLDALKFIGRQEQAGSGF